MLFNQENIQKWSELGSRGAFGVAMMELGASMDNLAVLTADLSDATRVTQFKKAYPDKFFNVGISEQNLLGMAAGMAKEGRLVFATTFAAFASMRACEQLRTNVGYMRMNVKVIGADAGVVMGTLGNTHYAVEDIAIARAMPYLTVLSPSDGACIVKATIAAAEHKGPVYMRLTGAANHPIVYTQDIPSFEIGKAVRVREGRNICLIATGSMVYHSLEAARLLEQSGVSAEVLDMHTIKPLDTEALDRAMGFDLIVTVEEHSVIGGLGSAVAEHKATKANAPRQILIGLPDRFGPIGTYACQLQRYQLTGPQIAERILSELNG